MRWLRSLVSRVSSTLSSFSEPSSRSAASAPTRQLLHLFTTPNPTSQLQTIGELILNSETQPSSQEPRNSRQPRPSQPRCPKATDMTRREPRQSSQAILLPQHHPLRAKIQPSPPPSSQD
ncbi:hypothetical protein N658DRAFT_526949, partial [Parathielavia hyrcaniae]